MKVRIDRVVHHKIDMFYDVALSLHDTLGEQAVTNKKNRMYSSLRELGEYAEIYSRARLKDEWINLGYREFICEDFHFAYEICVNSSGERFVWIHDAVHSLLYHN